MRQTVPHSSSLPRTNIHYERGISAATPQREYFGHREVECGHVEVFEQELGQFVALYCRREGSFAEQSGIHISVAHLDVERVMDDLLHGLPVSDYTTLHWCTKCQFATKRLRFIADICSKLIINDAYS